MSDSKGVINTIRDATTESLWHRFEELKSREAKKDQLIEELLYRYEYLSEQHKKECEEHDREREHNRIAQQAQKSLMEDMRKLQNFMNKDPFVLLLIDGDDMIFADQFLQEGEAGGKKAAEFIHQSIVEYMHCNLTDIPSDTKVVARVYANVKGLADVCYKTGVVNKPSLVEEFVRGFTRGNILFDFVDVGPGKGRADEKLAEIFKLHLYDFHCRHIILGGGHDKGYARLLEELAPDEGSIRRITLLEGVPFEKELATLPFTTHKMGHTFRETKINVSSNNNSIGIAPFPPASSVSPPPFYPVSRTVSTSNTPQPRAEATPAISWASAAAKAAALPMSSLPPAAKAVQQDPNYIPRNRKGQRIDSPPRQYDREEVNRVKKLKMCNVHFLRKACPFGDECAHVHDYKPTQAELETLRLVARMTPCTYGTQCEDPGCTYGHRCHAPEGKNGERCIFGGMCKFKNEMHNMDLTPVTLTKI
ncbi:hypothetical protein M501DRAFT_1032020 [Patellaria atrata CBS 101060]|uniref:C3H1-type domain-containing protein n=1 Tax=Patellaria atrata CBS 101060 TaxID=1346257 RepID=A0A9P4S8T1_9PEZI|nr:hypothetical protein M501DRAFT_1032020 [Patellaria atrata CBS 101060]